jgi:hypothetical protein
METQVMHYSQMTSAERQRAKAARRDDGGVRNRDGGVTYFHRCTGHVETSPSIVQFDRGIEDEPTVRCGPDLGKLWE